MTLKDWIVDESSRHFRNAEIERHTFLFMSTGNCEKNANPPNDGAGEATIGDDWYREETATWNRRCIADRSATGPR
eukprot:7236814-Pyramimonas_sp.AAC.1